MHLKTFRSYLSFFIVYFTEIFLVQQVLMHKLFTGYIKTFRFANTFDTKTCISKIWIYL